MKKGLVIMAGLFLMAATPATAQENGLKTGTNQMTTKKVIAPLPAKRMQPEKIKHIMFTKRDLVYLKKSRSVSLGQQQELLGKKPVAIRLYSPISTGVQGNNSLLLPEIYASHQNGRNVNFKDIPEGTAALSKLECGLDGGDGLNIGLGASACLNLDFIGQPGSLPDAAGSVLDTSETVSIGTIDPNISVGIVFEIR